MSIIEVTQLVEEIVLPAVCDADVAIKDKVPEVVCWIIGSPTTTEEMDAIIRAGIISAITAYGARFIGLRTRLDEQFLQLAKII
ncbi:hypothetical protein [Aeromonas veronii]|uniref:hypothetical protein n=1 Tax=Aeromonas veronii TaxID=654 RepID=UPI003BA3C9C6